METTDYASYELAQKLKACGFNEPRDHYYCAFDNETDVRFWSIHPAQSHNGFANPKDKVIAAAPTLWLAQKWLREKWGIHVFPTLESVNEVAYDCKVVYLRKEAYRLAKRYSNYSQALSEGIKSALELIKKGE